MLALLNFQTFKFSVQLQVKRNAVKSYKYTVSVVDQLTA